MKCAHFIYDFIANSPSATRTGCLFLDVHLLYYEKLFLACTDVFFNSSHEYEIAYLKKKITEMAESCTEEDQKRLKEIIPPEALRPFLGKDAFEIPQDSLFAEFYV